jgi:delta1-piperideine-2-carboxylate reductase
MSASPLDHAPSTTHLSYEALTLLLQRIFIRQGTSESVAQVLAENCASAERDGAHSHGVFRVPGYVSTLNSGWVDGKAVPIVEDVASGFVRWMR